MIFAPTNPEKIASQQLYEAKRLLLEHEVAAEYHQAMVSMCRNRIARLTPTETAEHSAPQTHAIAANKE